jgi:hypothetical protein
MHHHVSRNIGSILPAEVDSEPTTYPTAPEPTSQPRWAPVSPHVPWHQTEGEESRALRGLWLWILPPVERALGCHVSCGPLWAVGHKHKERPSMPTYAARPACSQCMLACF